ncbi:MAG: hypothetical protein LBB41_07385 [Prevotellaceae bacterium]|jgi:hypothetical protein|nr:hypothetical protein [Prevotellaceae bacterium]
MNEVEIQKYRPSLTLTKDEQDELAHLAALNYKPEEIALYFRIPLEDFINEMKNPESQIAYMIAHGQTVVRANVDMEMYRQAEKGNITAVQIAQRQMKEIRRRNLLNTIE